MPPSCHLNKYDANVNNERATISSSNLICSKSNDACVLEIFFSYLIWVK